MIILYSIQSKPKFGYNPNDKTECCGEFKDIPTFNVFRAKQDFYNKEVTYIKTLSSEQ